MTGRSVLILLVLGTAVLFAQAPRPLYKLTLDGRNVSSEPFRNQIRLRCHNVNDSVDDLRALFWLNASTGGQDLESQKDELGIKISRWTSDDLNRGGIQFLLTPELEGDYSCGVQIDQASVLASLSRKFVALPKRIPNLEVTAIRTFYAGSGQNATLLCPIQPGKLQQQYSVVWKRNQTTLQRFPALPVGSGLEKYKIDANTFSLTIFNVNIEDKSTLYTCKVSVTNLPDQGGQEYYYTQLSDLTLTLIVTDSPVITEGPQPQVVNLSQESATFNCSAAGISQPSIKWYHNAENPVKVGEKYAISPPVIKTEMDGRFLVTSTLTIKNFQITDNGYVNCSVPGQTSSAAIAVLGNPDRSNVIITQVMKLNVTYTDVSTNRNKLAGIMDEQYSNTKIIRHDARSGDVPQRFRVSVQIVAETNDGRRITGPAIDFGGEEYDKSTSNDCEFLMWITIVSILSVFLGLVAIVFLFVIVFFCVWKTRKNNEVKLKNIDANKDLADKAEDGQLLIEASTTARELIKVNPPQPGSDITITHRTILDSVLATLREKREKLKQLRQEASQKVFEGDGDEDSTSGQIPSATEEDIDADKKMILEVFKETAKFLEFHDEIGNEMKEEFEAKLKEYAYDHE